MSNNLKLRILGVGVLLMGVVLALPFRRSSPQLAASDEPSRPDLQLQQAIPPDTTADEFKQVVTRLQPLESHGVAPLPSVAPIGQPMPAVGEPGPLVNASEPGQNDSPQDAPPAPRMAPGYQPAIAPMIPRKPLPEEAKPRRHRLVDGDSLPDLAERFLGNRQRVREILAANSWLSPQLLPIGQVILIPPKIPVADRMPAKAETTLVPIR